MTHNISRFEEQGESLFICINSDNNPVYIEHFFNEEEKKDVKGTIERLVAELELLDEAYVAPLPRIDKLEEAKAITISKTKVASAKAAILEARVELSTGQLEEIVL